MNPTRQIYSRQFLVLLVIACALPSCGEAYAIHWGYAHGFIGKAMRDGMDFWAGGALALSGHLAYLYNQAAYQGFLTSLFGKLPYHLWSYPPTYLLLAAGFDWLSPWRAILSFDLWSLALFAAVLRMAGKSWWFVAAMLAAPANLESLLEHQNATLMTTLIGGGLLLLRTNPRLAGILIGVASMKPQLGLVLPLNLLRRSVGAFAYACLAAVLLAIASLHTFGLAAWSGFWHFTRPAMSAVLLTGQPPDFAGGLVSVFATFRFLGVHPALAIQGAVALAAIAGAAFTRSTPVLLILSALASPYLHDYDLLGAALAVALLVEQRQRAGFASGESVLFFIAWAGPGLLPWAAQFAHLTPVVLALLLASAVRSGGLAECDSSQVQPGSPALSAGPSPIPAPPASTAPG